VFLDLKLHDIPSTVAGAVRAARELGANLLTVHVAGGREMLEAAREAAGDDLGLLGVTVLTHLDQAALGELDIPGDVASRVQHWASLAAACSLRGLVCSPMEVGAIRSRHPSPFLLVTPGIRPAGSEKGDQRRVTTPAEALRQGADLLVVGRPLTRAADPAVALEALLGELAAA
jgi:orotidine-5'-phosphate decarboxylase